MSEVSPTQTHDGMGALHAGNTVESLRPRQGIEMNKDGPFQTERSRFEDTKNDFVMLEPEALPEPIAVEFTAEVDPNPEQPEPPPIAETHETTKHYEPTLDHINLILWGVQIMTRHLQVLEDRVATLESRLEAHNVRGSHKI